MRFSPLLMQLLIGMSMSRYFPATGIAGLERLLVSGYSRLPRPPPRMRLRIDSMERPPSEPPRAPAPDDRPILTQPAAGAATGFPARRRPPARRGRHAPGNPPVRLGAPRPGSLYFNDHHSLIFAHPIEHRPDLIAAVLVGGFIACRI